MVLKSFLAGASRFRTLGAAPRESVCAFNLRAGEREVGAERGASQLSYVLASCFPPGLPHPALAELRPYHIPWAHKQGIQGAYVSEKVRPGAVYCHRLVIGKNEKTKKRRT